MDTTQITQKLREIMDSVCLLGPDEPLDQAAPLVDVLQIDSLDKVEFIMEAEEQFDIMIDDTELTDQITFDDAVALIGRELAKKG